MLAGQIHHLSPHSKQQHEASTRMFQECRDEGFSDSKALSLSLFLAVGPVEGVSERCETCRYPKGRGGGGAPPPQRLSASPVPCESRSKQHVVTPIPGFGGGCWWILRAQVEHFHFTASAGESLAQQVVHLPAKSNQLHWSSLSVRLTTLKNTRRSLWAKPRMSFLFSLCCFFHASLPWNEARQGLTCGG